MSNMSGLPMPDTFKDVLTLTNNYQGLGVGLTQVQDAAGNSSPMQIALQAVNFDRMDGNTFQLDGVALTATAEQINIVCGGAPPNFTVNNLTVNNALLIQGSIFGTVAYTQLTYTPAVNTQVPLGNSVYIACINTVFTMDGQTVSVELPLPLSQVRGTVLYVKDLSGTLTAARKLVVSVDGGATIDGQATYDITTPYKSIGFFTDTVNWYTLST